MVMKKVQFISLIIGVLTLSACGESSAPVAVTTTPTVMSSSFPYESSLDDVSLSTNDELNKIAKNLNIYYSGTDVGVDFTKDLDNVNWDDSGEGLRKIQTEL